MKNTTPIQSYEGEQIYVGIDVHKKSYVLVARAKQTIVKKWTTVANPQNLAQQLLNYFAGAEIHSAYEAGFSGFVLYRVLQEVGIDLTPGEHSSGQQVHRGHITKQGNRHLRGLIVEIAWRAIRQDQGLYNYFERLHPRTGKKRAIIAVARKLIGKIRAAFRQGQHYQLDYLGESIAMT